MKKIKLFHASIADFNIFEANTFSHFGTRKAAIMRGAEVHQKRHPSTHSDGIHLYEVELFFENILKIRDGKNLFHTPLAVADILYYNLKKINDFERTKVIKASNISQQQAFSILSVILKDKGYDGLSYYNQHEDIGSVSYVIIDQSSIVNCLNKTHFDNKVLFDTQYSVLL